MPSNLAVHAVAALILMGGGRATPAADPPSTTITKLRTGTTQEFGSGTITRRSDGTSSTTRPFGSGSVTHDRDQSGKPLTGVTQKFGKGTITQWSYGTTTQTRPFGSVSITTDKPGPLSLPTKQ